MKKGVYAGSFDPITNLNKFNSTLWGFVIMNIENRFY